MSRSRFRSARPLLTKAVPAQVAAIWIAAGLAGCAAPAPSAEIIRDQTVIAPAPRGESLQPINLGQLKVALDRYHDSGAYLRDVAAVNNDAAAWVLSHAAGVAKPALVFDIDETSLSNWAELRANDYGFIPGGSCRALPDGPCGFKDWEERAAAPALLPTLALARAAQQAHVALFFITGRKVDLVRPTAANLVRAGYSGWLGLIMEPVGSHYASAADFKAPARAGIEANGYTILATVGDQYSDLAGGHALRGFKLPNPFYFLP